MNDKVKTAVPKNSLKIQLNILVFQEGEYYVSYCPSLNLSSYGHTIEEAKTGFDEVMTAFLEESNEDGSLYEDLIKNGWNLDFENNKKAEPPAMVDLDIPAGVLRKQFNENWTIPASLSYGH